MRDRHVWTNELSRPKHDTLVNNTSNCILKLFSRYIKSMLLVQIAPFSSSINCHVYFCQYFPTFPCGCKPSLTNNKQQNLPNCSHHRSIVVPSTPLRPMICCSLCRIVVTGSDNGVNLFNNCAAPELSWSYYVSNIMYSIITGHT